MRMTAEDRRADVLRVAVHEFAKRGYQGTSTEDVARAAGISQPYLFKMFPTKKTKARSTPGKLRATCSRCRRLIS